MCVRACVRACVRVYVCVCTCVFICCCLVFVVVCVLEGGVGVGGGGVVCVYNQTWPYHIYLGDKLMLPF